MGNGWIGPAAFHVFLDDVLVARQSGLVKDLDQPAANLYPLVIPIPETARFLTLVATDDGLPDPPATVTYTLLSLPAHGTVYDANGDAVTVARPVPVGPAPRRGDDAGRYR